MLEERQRLLVREEIQRHCRGQVLEEAEELTAFSRDFGSMIERRPALVFRPASEQDVPVVLRIAAQHGVPVTTRGAGHSQSGQSLGSGIVLDMRRLDRVLAVQAKDGVVEVESGATWRSVVDATFALGFLPLGLTHALDPTVAGTLSVAGVGGESFRCGPQVDSVLSFDVATLTGEIVRCSLDENRELFDAVRGGLGQCGVILRARYPLRPCKGLLTTRCFLYRDVQRFLDDASAAANPDAGARWLTSMIARDPHRPDRWVLLLFLGNDGDAQEPRAVLPRMSGETPFPPRTTRTWTADGVPGHPFFHLFGGRSARQQDVNPWVEHVLAFEPAAGALEMLLGEGSEPLRYGRAGVLFFRRGAAPAPLFVVPDGDLLVGVGVFATFSGADRLLTDRVMGTHVERMSRFPGKRYLSGYFAHRSVADWAEHYEGSWKWFLAAKAQRDPQNILNPEFILWK